GAGVVDRRGLGPPHGLRAVPARAGRVCRDRRAVAPAHPRQPGTQAARRAAVDAEPPAPAGAGGRCARRRPGDRVRGRRHRGVRDRPAQGVGAWRAGGREGTPPLLGRAGRGRPGWAAPGRPSWTAPGRFGWAAPGSPGWAAWGRFGWAAPGRSSWTAPASLARRGCGGGRAGRAGHCGEAVLRAGCGRAGGGRLARLVAAARIYWAAWPVAPAGPGGGWGDGRVRGDG